MKLSELKVADVLTAWRIMTQSFPLAISGGCAYFRHVEVFLEVLNQGFETYEGYAKWCERRNKR